MLRAAVAVSVLLFGSGVAHADEVAAPAAAAAAASPDALDDDEAILGFLVILVLAYLAGHPRVQRIEERLGIAQVVTAGFPFVLLGLVAHHPSIGLQ